MTLLNVCLLTSLQLHLQTSKNLHGLSIICSMPLLAQLLDLLLNSCQFVATRCLQPTGNTTLSWMIGDAYSQCMLALQALNCWQAAR